ncbi:hypothetical protein BDV37DRAFT_240281 [Aspergillus pseudonomiae]|uniref:Uncharacterized protein n=1 Tax=Aspergillus pseudonomiae TaxID=1506151 RepID=A0A5N7DN53_9EURO|nr:uncharacterized protein BDV37DRAFT_240281 [Aspergillus pseudonomiae]KAE8407880.1 hypothetical protein BDV37DRAFT_240281 [Aspergillus pseudonomiae]
MRDFPTACNEAFFSLPLTILISIDSNNHNHQICRQSSRKFETTREGQNKDKTMTRNTIGFCYLPSLQQMTSQGFASIYIFDFIFHFSYIFFFSFSC